MTTEEVKAYLWQAYKLDKRLQREKRKLDKLRSSVEYRSPSFEGNGSGCGGADKLGDAVTRIIERSERVDELAAEYAKKYEEVEKCIRAIEDDALEEVLELRYLQYMKWEEIANAMHYTERRVLQLHGLALHKISLYFSI